MKLETVMGCLILAAILAAFIIPMVMMLRKSTRRRVRFNALGDGTHCVLSLKADAAITTRFLLVKRGTDANHLAVIAAASDQPLGVATDEAAAAEDSVAVKLLGICKETVLMVAQGTILKDVDVYSYGDGTITVVPTVAGTYWKVGRSITASTVGLEIEVEPCVPQKVVVIAVATAAALTGALTGTADGALVDIAATAGGCAGTTTPSATNVDAAIATAVASIVTGTNEQLKELLTMVNKLTADNAAQRTGIATPTLVMAAA
jgi:hypothetical protein